MIVGITGGTGCGKTTALEAVRRLGGVTLDCDAVYHQMLQTDPALLSAISGRFPGTVENGVLKREKLGKLVFADQNALLELNRITHAAVRQEILHRLTPMPRLAAIEAIALFESGLSELCDVTVAVTAPEDVRIARLMARDGISAEYAAMRIAAQKEQCYFQEKCDYTLENDGDPAGFTAKCLAFFQDMVIIEKNAKENCYDN